MCTSISLFFFNDTATTEIYTLSLHDALPICPVHAQNSMPLRFVAGTLSSIPTKFVSIITSDSSVRWTGQDRKSTRLNSSHANISYAVFCLKKKKHNVMNSSHQTSRNRIEHSS